VPTSFYIFLVASFIALIPAWFDHGETWEEIKSGDKNKKCQNLMKLSALWIIPILTIIGTVYLGIESVASGRQEKRHEADLTSAHKDIFNLSNQVQQVSSEYNEATNALAQAKQAAIDNSNVLVQANKTVDKLQPRRINVNDQQKLFLGLQYVPRANVVINLDPTIPDAENLAKILANVLVQRGFPIVGVDRVTRMGVPANHGIAVNVIGTRDSAIASGIIDAFNSIGLNAHAPDFGGVGGFTQSGNFSGSATNGVLYIDFGFQQ
jgi:hypothetical protein